MPSREAVRAVSQRIHALAGGSEVRRKAVARVLAGLDGIEATELIHHLMSLAKEGSDTAACVLTSLSAALSQEAASLPSADMLRRVARLQELEHVAAMFGEAPALLQLDVGIAAKADAARLSDTPLGVLKQRARTTRNPDELARLAMASEPSVVRNLLLNPRLTEPLVVRIAARRPARPEPLREIWNSPRWGTRRLVRRALVFNPYLPPEIGSKILPLMPRTDWAEIANAGGIHPSLREQAKLLLEAHTFERSEVPVAEERLASRAPDAAGIVEDELD